MITERTIINSLIIGATCILVPFIISTTLTPGTGIFEYAPVLFFGGLGAMVVSFFFLKDNLCICPLLGAGVTGSLNFLPLPLNATDIACILLVLYYITGYVIIRQKRIKLGKTKFLWPILIVTSIVLYHNHSLNVGVLGGETEGGRAAILIYLVVLAYFCGINIAHPTVYFLSLVPFTMVVLTAITSLPFFLTTYFPSLAPILYYVTGNVNVEAYVESQVGAAPGGEGAIGRLGSFGTLGATLQLYLLCHYPIGTWLRPERWWVIGLSLVCTIFAIASGFRNVLFGFALMTMIGAWAYYSWRSLVLPGALFIVGFILILASSNNVIRLPTDKLPLIAQRTLSFLPGNWSGEAIESAKASNQFRTDIQDVYIKEYLKKSPLFGNGFNIDTKEYESYGDALKRGNEDPRYAQAKVFIEGKLFHTGWISVYDTVGIVGGLAFVALGWSEIRMALHFVFGPKADHRSSLFPFYVWILCNIVTMMVSYFTVFGDFSQTFINLCVYAIVLSHLSDIESITDIPVPLRDRKEQFEYTGLKGALYGYQSKH